MRLLKPALRPSAGDLVQVGDHLVRLALNPRARRIALRLDSTRAEIVLTTPNMRRVGEALTFAQSRRDWIATRLAELAPPIRFAPGVLVPVGGEPCRLERAAMRIRPRLVAATAEEDARLIASGEGEAFARAVERGLRAEALTRLQASTAHHCRTLGLPAPPLALQDARSRWGSCRRATAEQGASIRYNWRLVCAPSAVLDYVAAHECAHLVEANHGPRFWALVRRLYGEPAPARAWLKAQGAALHALGR